MANWILDTVYRSDKKVSHDHAQKTQSLINYGYYGIMIVLDLKTENCPLSVFDTV